jgi:hypothetical protein
MGKLTSEKVLEDELKLLASRRNNGIWDTSEPSAHELTGLALSGGGVRSATFCFGVCQALSAATILSKFDYISSVSGGGYTAATITSLLADGHTADLSTPIGYPESWIQSYLRRNASYLASQFSEALGFLMKLVLSTTFNFVIITPALIVLAVLLQALSGVWAATGLQSYQVILIFVSITLLLSILNYVVLGVIKKRHVQESIQIFFGIELSFYVILGCGVLFVAYQKPAMIFLVQMYGGLSHVTPTQLYSAIAGAAGLIGLFVGVFRGLFSKLREILSRSWHILVGVAVPIILWVIVLLIELSVQCTAWIHELPWADEYLFSQPAISKSGLITAAGDFLLARGQQSFADIDTLNKDMWEPVCLQEPTGTAVAVAFWIAAGLVLLALTSRANVNTTSLHSYYRERIKDAFRIWITHRLDGSPRRRDIKLSDTSLEGPYHLINACVNMQTSKAGRVHLGAGGFLFSRLYCGGDSIGYCCTGDLERADEQLDLATAIAISGAAIAPNQGQRHNRFLRLLLGLANVRLGYWMLNPSRVGPAQSLSPVVSPYWYFVELVGRLNENRKRVYVTDGGHFENLGLYELIRRRCRYILALDAEQDARSAFHGLAQAARLVKIDFGYEVDIDVSPLVSAQNGLSRAHAVLGRIKYSESESGVLVYVKASMTGDEHISVREYKARSPTFPHETTADQFFTESQYEAYRNLGEHVGGLLVASKQWPDLVSLFRQLQNKWAPVSARPSLPDTRVAAPAPGTAS